MPRPGSLSAAAAASLRAPGHSVASKPEFRLLILLAGTVTLTRTAGHGDRGIGRAARSANATGRQATVTAAPAFRVYSGW